MNTNLILVIGVMASTAACAYSVVDTQQSFKNGEYHFIAKKIDQSKGICLFDGFSFFVVTQKQQEKLLVLGDNCDLLSSAKNPIHIEASVDLTADNYREILTMLKKSNEESCENNAKNALLLCLKDEMPRFVTRKENEYTFWYGRAMNPGDGGIGITLVKRNGSFEFLR